MAGVRGVVREARNERRVFGAKGDIGLEGLCTTKNISYAGRGALVPFM
jgi:hypothetical protein